MNAQQKIALTQAIAMLVEVLTDIARNSVTATSPKADSLVATTPASPTHLNPKAPKATKTATGLTVNGVAVTAVKPATATKPVKGAKVKNPEKLALTPAGLIDITKLSGLVKARAVAANNRTIAAAKAA